MAVGLGSVPTIALGQTAVEGVPREESFSTKGTVVSVDGATDTLRLRNEGGLELTFHANNPAQLSGLGADDPIEIEYRYNENYEKVIQSVKKQGSEIPTQISP